MRFPGCPKRRAPRKEKRLYAAETGTAADITCWGQGLLRRRSVSGPIWKRRIFREPLYYMAVRERKAARQKPLWRGTASLKNWMRRSPGIRRMWMKWPRAPPIPVFRCSISLRALLPMRRGRRKRAGARWMQWSWWISACSFCGSTWAIRRGCITRLRMPAAAAPMWYSRRPACFIWCAPTMWRKRWNCRREWIR